MDDTMGKFQLQRHIGKENKEKAYEKIDYYATTTRALVLISFHLHIQSMSRSHQDRNIRKIPTWTCHIATHQ